MLVCLECGLSYKLLSSHIRVHSISWREYLLKHKLPLGSKACVPELIEKSKVRFEQSPSSKAMLAFVRSDAFLQMKADTAERARERSLETYKTRFDPETKRTKTNILTRPDVKRKALEARIAAGLLKGTRVTRTCSRCNKQYQSSRSMHKSFCSKECHAADRTQRLETRRAKRLCPSCHSSFVSERNCVYCCRACRPQNVKGITHCEHGDEPIGFNLGI